MISNERLLQEEITPGLEGLTTEERLHRLYDLFCETGREDYLGDLLLNAERMGFAIAYNALKGNSHFLKSDFMDYLQEISLRLMKKLCREYAEGKRQENIVFTVRSFYQKRAWDIRDALAAKLNGRSTVSLETLNESPDGKPVDKVGREDEQSDEEQELAKEKAELCRRIIQLYIRNMMSSDEAPPRVMALCYSRILYQMEMLLDGAQVEKAARKVIEKDRRTKTSELEKMVEAFMKVRQTGKTSSPGWALERMGCRNFAELKADSEQSIQQLFDEEAAWQQPFLLKLPRRSDRPDGSLWKDVVYTEQYNVKKTSAWAKSLHEKIIEQMMDQVEADADLDGEVMRLDTPLKTIMQNLGRGKGNVPFDER